MHQILASFFALIFAFGHTAPAPRNATALAVAEHSQVADPAPTRQELMLTARANRYAGSACLSCRRPDTVTNLSYRAR